MIHEISEGFIRKIGRNYYMILTIDGQRQQRKTGTSDPVVADDMLQEWRAQAKMGLTQDTRLKYEAMRDEYLASGKKIQESVQRDLDAFFKGMRISAIDVDAMERFRQFRESKAEVLEYKAEMIAKEIAWRTKKVEVTEERAKIIKREATAWVENGIKATTNKRLVYLRAMFRHLAKRGKIKKTDVPFFPITTGVDNKRRGFLEKQDLPRILATLPGHLRLVVRFIYETGMRSGAAARITWDMINKECTEMHISGEIMKSGEDLVLPLVDNKGKPLFDFVVDLRKMSRTSGPVFDVEDLRGQWRIACDKLGFGLFDKETRSYRGLRLHDFRRSACRNMTRRRVPQVVAMAISGHKTDSIFRRYAITDQTSIQESLSQAR